MYEFFDPGQFSSRFVVPRGFSEQPSLKNLEWADKTVVRAEKR